MTYGVLAGCAASQITASAPSAWPTWNGSLDGAVTTYSTVIATLNKVVKLDTNKVLVVFVDGASTIGKAVVGTISGTTVTWGSVVAYSGASTIGYHSVATLSPTQAIATYFDNAGLTAKSIILDISGTVITPGTPATIQSSVDLSGICVCSLSASKAVVAYCENNTGKGNSAVLSVSGSTITAGSIFAFTPTNTASHPDISTISSTQALVVYSDDNNNNFGTSQVLNISGATITGNTSYVFYSGIAIAPVIAQITSSTYAVVYDDGVDNDYPYNVTLSVSGAVVTSGTPAKVVSNIAVLGSGYYSVAKADSSNAFIAYPNVTTGNSTARVSSIAGTANTLRTPVNLKSSDSTNFSGCNIDDFRVISVWADSANSGKGTSKISKSA